MIIDTSLSVKSTKITESRKIVTAIRSNEAGFWIDVRSWMKFQNNDDFFPTRKGITLSLENWIKVRKDIDALIEEAKSL